MIGFNTGKTVMPIEVDSFGNLSRCKVILKGTNASKHFLGHLPTSHRQKDGPSAAVASAFEVVQCQCGLHHVLRLQIHQLMLHHLL